MKLKIHIIRYLIFSVLFVLIVIFWIIPIFSPRVPLEQQYWLDLCEKLNRGESVSLSQITAEKGQPLEKIEGIGESWFVFDMYPERDLFRKIRVFVNGEEKVTKIGFASEIE